MKLHRTLSSWENKFSWENDKGHARLLHFLSFTCWFCHWGYPGLLQSTMNLTCPIHLLICAFCAWRESVGAPAGEEHGQDVRQQNGPQRQVVVRRFHFAFQLDLALIIKLAAVVFLFSQEGSKQRLFLLILFASLIYLWVLCAYAPFFFILFLSNCFSLLVWPIVSCYITSCFHILQVSNWSNYTFPKMAAARWRCGCASTTGSCSGWEPCSSGCPEWWQWPTPW